MQLENTTENPWPQQIEFRKQSFDPKNRNERTVFAGFVQEMKKNKTHTK